MPIAIGFCPCVRCAGFKQIFIKKKFVQGDVLGYFSRSSMLFQFRNVVRALWIRYLRIFFVLGECARVWRHEMKISFELQGYKSMLEMSNNRSGLGSGLHFDIHLSSFTRWGQKNQQIERLIRHVITGGVKIDIKLHMSRNLKALMRLGHEVGFHLHLLSIAGYSYRAETSKKKQ